MTNFDELMRTHDPATTIEPLSPARRAEILALCQSSPAPSGEVTAGPAGSLTRMSRHRRPRRWARVLIAAAVAMLVIFGIVQVSATRPATAEATELLKLAAGKASDPPALAHQYWEVERSGTSLVRDDSGTFVVAQRDFDYIPVDGGRPQVMLRGASVPVRRLDASAAPLPERTLGSSDWAFTSDGPVNAQPGSWQIPTPEWMVRLPRDTQALRARLYSDSHGHGTGEHDSAFTYASDALRNAALPAHLRAALFQVIQTIPGTAVTDRSIEIDGRTGVGIGRSDVFGTKRELVFDTSSGELIGERERTRYGPVPFVGPSVDLTTSYTRRVVDEVPEDVLRMVERCRPDAEGRITC